MTWVREDLGSYRRTSLDVPVPREAIEIPRRSIFASLSQKAKGVRNGETVIEL